MTTPVLIADDEEAPRAQLRAALHAVWPDAVPVLECDNGIDAWDAFLEHEPPVCFLDVRMPGLTGIDVARRIGDRASVVFVAAPGDHALAAFDGAAFDVLRKPVDRGLLAAAVRRVQGQIAEPETRPGDLDGLIDRLSSRVRKVVPLQELLVGTGDAVRTVRLDDVIYLAADARSTRIVCRDGEVTLRTPLKVLLAQIDPAQFWQIHRSVIVNRRYIDAPVRVDDDLIVTLRGRDERLPVARHFQGLFARSV